MTETGQPTGDTGSARSRQQAAAEVWRIMSDYTMCQFRRKSGTLHDLGLTPGHMKALMSLEPGEATPMGACASELGCDASTATWLIDRLEEKGMVERRPSRVDRRVKGVVLTAEGIRTRSDLLERHYDPPEALLKLSFEDLENLLALLGRMADMSEDGRLPEGDAGAISAAGSLSR